MRIKIFIVFISFLTTIAFAQNVYDVFDKWAGIEETSVLFLNREINVNSSSV